MTALVSWHVRIVMHLSLQRGQKILQKTVHIKIWYLMVRRISTRWCVEPYAKDEENPYIKAFWDWWEDGLSESLEELRITGGEPLMSDQVWKLFDWFNENPSKMRFAINSNLMAKDSLIDRLIERSQGVNDFHLYTSCEATGLQLIIFVMD